MRIRELSMKSDIHQTDLIFLIFFPPVFLPYFFI